MSKQYDYGDKIKVLTDSKEIVGTSLPRPEILDENILVLKLENGYNIGIDKKKIKKVEVLEKYKAKTIKNKTISHKKGLPTVSIISAGGTISSKIDYKTGGTVADYTAEDFMDMIPEIQDIANVKAVKCLNVMSEDMNESDWKTIAKSIEKELETAEGIVLSQGTDTLHYTSAILSFYFKDVKKPIILTAAQRSIDRGSSDAFMNLACATNAAANFEGAGVFVCMHANSSDDFCQLIRGTKVRKMHTSRRDAFRPINSSPVAEIYTDKINILDKDFTKKDLKNKTKTSISFEEKVGLLYIQPLIDPKIVDFYVKEGYKGLVISATALGHVPSEGKNNLITALEKAKKKGLTIVVASQTLYGSTNEFVYANLRKLSVALNLIFAKDMSPETSLVKLGWILGQTNDENEIKEMFETNYAYEYNDKISEDEFLN
ncbi:Glu-tRNA(Gln) amidotransferase GatDE subunit D [Candidatus Woesearchaeota archaeon]|nr:MAG: Glu-tRNA(Gln) amidotransferase GatDE subunit D [Candidatus Woesearchaeota archaeon]